jgi:hypothetical protein
MHGRRDLILLLAASALCIACFTGCGRTPPAALWSWTAEDSTKVTTLVAAWKDSMKSHFEEDSALSEAVTYLPDTTRKLLRKAVKDNPFKQHWFPRMFYRRFDSLHVVSDSITQTKDTTVTVKLLEYFDGKVYMRLDSATKYLGDSVIGGITYRVYGNSSDTTGNRFRYMRRDSVFPQDTLLLIPVHGVAESYLYFEPNDKVNRTDWVLKRLSGGKRYASPDEATAPYLGALQLTTPAGRRDTIVLRPDSLHYGMQRLYRRDSLLTYRVGDSISIEIVSGFVLNNYSFDPIDITGFVHLPNPADPERSIRRCISTIPATTINTTFAFSTPGLQFIYIELIPRPVLSERVENFSSRVWGIPIQVTP